MIARRVVVRGQVQGVFFRDTCRREAQSRQLSGWVSNRGDGSVEAFFEGAPSDVAALVRWCEVGPRYAVVEGVEVTDEEPTGADGFTVR